MKKFIFDLITAPFSLFENPIYNYIAMTVIGVVAFKFAFSFVAITKENGKKRKEK